MYRVQRSSQDTGLKEKYSAVAVIDGWFLSTPRQGAFTYLVNIIPELAKQNPNVKFVVYVPDSCDIKFLDSNVEVNRVRNYSRVLRFFFLPYLSPRLPNFLLATYTLPLVMPSGTRSILVMHDLIWRELPQLFSFRYRALRRVLFGLAIRKADSIVTISNGSANAISKFYPQCRNKIIFHGIGDSLQNESWHYNSKGFDGEAVIKGRYLLTVGRHEPRKNYDRLVRAYGKSKSARLMKLVIVGYVDKNFETQQESDCGVMYLTDVSDSQLSNIYRNCTVFIFPSLAEGYGLPVREALQYKKPVLVSNTFPCKPTIELCAGIFDPESVSAISRSIDEVTDRILREEFIGPTDQELAMLPTWQSHVACVSKLF